LTSAKPAPCNCMVAGSKSRGHSMHREVNHEKLSDLRDQLWNVDGNDLVFHD
jgi:hypothetical protein